MDERDLKRAIESIHPAPGMEARIHRAVMQGKPGTHSRGRHQKPRMFQGSVVAAACCVIAAVVVIVTSFHTGSFTAILGGPQVQGELSPAEMCIRDSVRCSRHPLCGSGESRIQSQGSGILPAGLPASPAAHQTGGFWQHLPERHFPRRRPEPVRHLTGGYRRCGHFRKMLGSPCHRHSLHFPGRKPAHDRGFLPFPHPKRQTGFL